MSEFVKLTSAYVSGALYINPLHIEYFHARKDGGTYVCILADGDRAHYVTETPEQIMALIERAMAERVGRSAELGSVV